MALSLDVLSNSILGSADILGLVTSGGATGTALAALNAGYATRFRALDTKDVKSVKLHFATVSAAGTIQVRIETVDATRKPSGTLYDANASKSFTPVAGWNTVTFDSLPTTGLTAETEYALVLLTTTGGTTMTISGNFNGQFLPSYPAVVLTAADGTTRSNFAEVASTLPLCTYVMEDDSEESFGSLPFPTQATFAVYGTRAAGVKVTLAGSIKISGYDLIRVNRNGTPSGNFRIRVFDSSNNVVSGTTVTVTKESLANSGQRSYKLLLPAPVTLAAGTYRIVVDQTDHASTSGNNFTLTGGTSHSAAVVPSGWIMTTTTDIDAGTISWTDTATSILGINFRLADVPAASGAFAMVLEG